MLFRIAKENQERAGKAFIVECEKNNFGYKKSGILKPKSNRIMHYYEVDMIDADRIICTVRHKNTDCIVALVWLSGYTPESIEVDQAELYRNCSNYPYRREYNEKYLKKYDQIACIVHGAIINGLLFGAESDKEPEAVQDTTCSETEPQRATETAQKTTDMETFKKEYSRIYSHLYEHEGQPGVDATRRKYSRLFDESWEQIKDIVKAFCQKSGDLLTSDRQCASFMKTLETVGAPTDGETATDGQTTTTTETDAQRAAESAETTADDTTTAGSDTDRTEGSQQCTESAKATTGRNGEARTARHDKTTRMSQDARKTHHPTKYPPTAQKAHKRQNTKPRQAAQDGQKATGNTRKMAFWGSDVNDRQKSAVPKHPPPFVKRFRQRFETLISDRFLGSGVRG